MSDLDHPQGSNHERRPDAPGCEPNGRECLHGDSPHDDRSVGVAAGTVPIAGPLEVQRRAERLLAGAHGDRRRSKGRADAVRLWTKLSVQARRSRLPRSVWTNVRVDAGWPGRWEVTIKLKGDEVYVETMTLSDDEQARRAGGIPPADSTCSGSAPLADSPRERNARMSVRWCSSPCRGLGTVVAPWAVGVGREETAGGGTCPLPFGASRPPRPPLHRRLSCYGRGAASVRTHRALVPAGTCPLLGWRGLARFQESKKAGL